MSYQINVNKYGGIYWDMRLENTDYNHLEMFIKEMQETKYKHITKNNYGYHNGFKSRVNKKDIDNLQLLLTEDGKKYFQIIKESLEKLNKDEIIEIKDINKYLRLIIYIICKIFGLKCETIKSTEKLLIPCTNFSDNGGCGCDYAPAWFHRNHHDNNYEDTISYSYCYRTCKTGVRLYKI